MASLEIVDTPAQAAEQELPPLIVRDVLEAFLDANGLGEGPIEAERIGEGHSNVTYLIRRGDDCFVLRRAIPETIDNPEGRAQIADELIRALVEVHALDWRACGLEGFGKPTGYLDRQLRRFSGLW